jgi:uncharacterized membrane protein YfcA
VTEIDLGVGTIAALAGIAFLGSLVYGITGFGSALVTIPLATHIVPLPFALAMFAVVDLFNAVRVGLENPRNAVKPELYRLVPMMLVGVVLGVTLVVNLPRDASMLALGVFVFLYAVYSLTRRSGVRIADTRWAYFAGVAGGITGTLFGAGGPPYAIYLSHRQLTKEQFRATLSLTTVCSISLRILAFVATGLLLYSGPWIAAAIALPAAYAGVTVTTHVFRRVSRMAVARAVALVLLATGASLIVRALS